jgi:hypothetical protein
MVVVCLGIGGFHKQPEEHVEGLILIDHGESGGVMAWVVFHEHRTDRRNIGSINIQRVLNLIQGQVVCPKRAIRQISIQPFDRTRHRAIL